MRRNESNYALKIIDIHTHPLFFEEGENPADTALKVSRARALGIERMVSLGDVLRFGGQPDAKQTRIINDGTMRVMERAPEFWIGFCALNPLLGEKAVKTEVERCVGGMGFRGLKLEISCNATHPALRWVMEAARQWDVPVLQHSWSQTIMKKRKAHSDPEDTCALARRWPEVNVIMAHLTGCGYRGVKAAKGLNNLWVDTSGGAPEAGLVEYAVAELGASRVLYGSDAPIRDLPVTVGRITGADISASAKRAVLAGNAIKLLKL